MDDIGDGVDEVVEDEVKAEEVGGFLRDVLGVDGAARLADGMGDIHQQGTGTGGGVVAGDILDLIALPNWDED